MIFFKKIHHCLYPYQFFCWVLLSRFLHILKNTGLLSKVGDAIFFLICRLYCDYAYDIHVHCVNKGRFLFKNQCFQSFIVLYLVLYLELDLERPSFVHVFKEIVQSFQFNFFST